MKHVERLQKFFPYGSFLSPTFIVNKFKCNICGKTYKLRKKCEHKVGEIYNGKMCTKSWVAEDVEIPSISFVDNPVQKYRVCFIDGKDYNYSLLENISSNLESPFHGWNYEESKKLQPHSRFNTLSKDDNCPCESGKTYGECCLKKEGVLRPHFQISYSVKPKNGYFEEKYFE